MNQSLRYPYPLPPMPMKKIVRYEGQAINSLRGVMVSCVKTPQETLPRLGEYRIGDTAVFSCGYTLFGFKLKSMKL